MAKSGVTKTSIKNVPVQMGRFVLGDETCSISIKLSRETMESCCGGMDPVSHFDHVVCGKRVKVTAAPSDDADGQQIMGAWAEGEAFTGEAKVKSGGIGRKRFTFTAQFDLSELEEEDRARLMALASRSALVTLHRKGELRDGRSKVSTVDEETETIPFDEDEADDE